MQLDEAWRDSAIDFTHDDRPATGVLDHTRLEVIRAEIHEAAHGPLVAHDRFDDELVQAVLRRDHVAVAGEVRRKGARRGVRVLSLHREHDVLERAVELVG